MINIFNFKRFFLTLKNDIIRNSRTYLVTLGAIAGVITAIDMLPGIITGKTITPVAIFIPIMIPLGFIFSSTVFNEMHDPQKGLVFLTTPSSTFEKLLSKLLITTVLYIPAMFLYFHLLTFFINGINTLFFGSAPQHFDFNWNLARYYIILQSIFLFASSYFKKNALLKLLFAGFLLQMFFSFFSIINFKLFFDFPDFSNFNFNSIELSMDQFATFAKNSFYISKFIFLWILAPFFWIMTYLRIAEKEI
jgi:hypothetical protein